LAFNVGYHNEHHDFPNIPWTLLPELRKIAPEYYDMPECKSWTWAIIDFIRTPGFGPYSRIKRKEPSSTLSTQVEGGSESDLGTANFIGKEDL
jgi:sphingolipid delta-4 desaturase